MPRSHDTDRTPAGLLLFLAVAAALFILGLVLMLIFGPPELTYPPAGGD